MLPFRRYLVRAGDASVRAIARMRKTDIPLSGFRNFLLVQHHIALGAAVQTTPIIQALHAVVPGARVAAVASGYSLDLLATNPGIERVVSWPGPRENFIAGVRTIRDTNFFEGEPFVSLHAMGNSRMEFMLAAMLGGARYCLNFAIQPRSASSIAYDRLQSRIANDLRFLHVLGHGKALAAALSQQPDLIEPRVFFTVEHLNAAKALLREHGTDPGSPFAVFVTQSRPIPVRFWPPEKFHAVARWVHHELQLPIVFTGTRSEVAVIDALRAPLDFPTVNLAGRTSMLELAALLSLASVGLTHDTGTMHMGRAVGLPMVVLAPAAEIPIEWLPLGNPRVRILYHAYAAPGLRYTVPGEVSAELVQENLLELLQLYGPTATA